MSNVPFYCDKIDFSSPPHPHPMFGAWLNAKHDEIWNFLPYKRFYNDDLSCFHGNVSTYWWSDKLRHVNHVAWPLDVWWRLLWIFSFLEGKSAIFFNIGWGCGGERIRRLWKIWRLRSYRCEKNIWKMIHKQSCGSLQLLKWPMIFLPYLLLCACFVEFLWKFTFFARGSQ